MNKGEFMMISFTPGYSKCLMSPKKVGWHWSLRQKTMHMVTSSCLSLFKYLNLWYALVRYLLCISHLMANKVYENEVYVKIKTLILRLLQQRATWRVVQSGNIEMRPAFQHHFWSCWKSRCSPFQRVFSHWHAHNVPPSIVSKWTRETEWKLSTHLGSSIVSFHHAALLRYNHPVYKRNEWSLF